MPAQFSSRTVVWPENSDTVVVMRWAKTGTSWTGTTVYSGVADLQEGSGTLAYNAAGIVIESDARLFIDADPLPSIKVDDEIIANGSADQTYTVVSTSLYTMSPVHLELNLKRGPAAWKGKT